MAAWAEEASDQIEKSYRQKLAVVDSKEGPIRIKLVELNAIPIDPLRVEIASKIIKLYIECCRQQYSQIEKIPAIVEPVSGSLDNALKIIDGIVQKVKEKTLGAGVQ